MKKTNLIALAVIAVILVGTIFVSAAFQEEKEEFSVQQPSETCGAPQQTCGSETCNLQCGGSCGIPSCGCSK